MLRTAEIQEIKNQFDKVIAYSQGIEDPKTDKLFDIWYTQKRHLFMTFGEKFIYEFPEKVSFELGKKAKHDRVVRFIEDVYHRWGYLELSNFIELQEEGFFQNLTVADYTTRDGKLIKKGTKLVKAFKHFINNERSLTDIQNEASRIIQEDKIEGTLCLSIHPLDFLSISETTYNWRSCHSLDGEYRAGNLSYMMDKSTVICYLKSDKEEKLPNFPIEVPWNSKKWRVLLYISNDGNLIFSGKQYPFETQSGMDFVLNNLLPDAGLIRGESWSEWNNAMYPSILIEKEMETYYDLSVPFVPIDNRVIAVPDLMHDAVGSKHFNDVLRSSSYKPIYTCRLSSRFFVGLETKIDTSNFTIGNFTYCLKCGEAEVITAADTMMCEDCELEYGNSDSDLFRYCECCESRVLTDDLMFVYPDMYYCPSCFDTYCTNCEHCGDPILKDDAYYDEELSMFLCEDCYNNAHSREEDE